jgi:hypothetical protein
MGSKTFLLILNQKKSTEDLPREDQEILAFIWGLTLHFRLFFDIGSHCEAQFGLKFTILLPQPWSAEIIILSNFYSSGTLGRVTDP